MFSSIFAYKMQTIKLYQNIWTAHTSISLLSNVSSGCWSLYGWRNCLLFSIVVPSPAKAVKILSINVSPLYPHFLKKHIGFPQPILSSQQPFPKYIIRNTASVTLMGSSLFWNYNQCKINDRQWMTCFLEFAEHLIIQLAHWNHLTPAVKL